jgi:ribosomal protein S14
MVDCNMTEREMVIISMGIDATHYHKIKWVPCKYSYGGERLSTICGRDSAIYDIEVFELSRVKNSHTPCKICYKNRGEID